MFNYNWSIKNGYPKTKNKYNVFGTFICGGGSTMGYKLAGYNTLGGVEIDPEVANIYETNHQPKYLYLQDLRLFNEREDLPKELFNLDILDGSPPCSTFSMAGSREKAWGKSKKFREGQVDQTLDDLVFVYIETIKKLQPKVFILENVKGIILGNAKDYSKKIVNILSDAGYNVQIFMLDASFMGVPQKRERVFFIGVKKDFNLQPLKLSFNEKPVTFRELERNCNFSIGEKITDTYKTLWENTPPGKSLSVAHEKGSFFNTLKVAPNKVLGTIIASSGGKILHYQYPNDVSDEILIKASSFPYDYNFIKMKPKYLLGMSVPPVMIANIAEQIKNQWLDKI